MEAFQGTHEVLLDCRVSLRVTSQNLWRVGTSDPTRVSPNRGDSLLLTFIRSTNVGSGKFSRCDEGMPPGQIFRPDMVVSRPTRTHSGSLYVLRNSQQDIL